MTPRLEEIRVFIQPITKFNAHRIKVAIPQKSILDKLTQLVHAASAPPSIIPTEKTLLLLDVMV